jgi:hypothetical protein
MGPLAKKLIAEIEKHVRAGQEPDVLKSIRHPGPIEVPSDFLPGVFMWMRSYQYLVRIASGIMGSHTLRKFTDLVRLTDEEYLPHGPPDSPITDSFFFGWWALDREVGKGETIATIVADLAQQYGGAKEEIERIRTLAKTHLRVLRIVHRNGQTARLQDLLTKDEVDVGLAAPWDGDAGQLWLARAVPEMCFTPYAIDGADDAEWLAYFERKLGDAKGKELRERYRDLMRGVPDNLWLEYILDAYYEGNQHTLHLRGIPDRPETLPHSEENFSLFDEVPPDDPRDRVMHELLLTDLLMESLGDFMSAREGFELPATEPDEEMLLDPMLVAYASYGIVLDTDKTFLEEFIEKHSDTMDEEDLADLRAIANGWFSVFEIQHVKLDEGMEVKDLLRRKKLWIEEKAATRQIALGDVLAAWVQDYGDRLTLEGSNLHFPRMSAEAVKGFLKDYYKSVPKDLPWRERLASIVPVVAGLHETLRERPPIPTILNERGEEIVFSQARYILKADVTDKLEEAGWQGEDGSYVLIEDDRFFASAEIEGDRMKLFATSPAQLESAKQVIEQVLGQDAVHQTDVFEDAQVAVAEGRPIAPPDELTPEMQAELRSFLERELQAWLDTPIPMLGNRTPREAVRTQRGKEDVQMMLLEQERILEGHEQLEEPIDFRPLWASLGLEYPS